MAGCAFFSGNISVAEAETVTETPAAVSAGHTVFRVLVAVDVVVVLLLAGGFLFYMKLFKQQKEMYSEKAQQLRLVVDSVSEGLIVTDTAARVMLINPAACEQTHYLPQELEGRLVTDMLRREAREGGKTLPSLVEKTLQDGRIHRDAQPVFLVGKDGFRMPVTECAGPILDQKGNYTGAVLMFRNLAQEYEARDRIQWSDLLLMQAADVAKILFFVCDRDGKFISAPVRNDNWGWQEENDGQAVLAKQWVHPDDLAEYQQAWRRLVSGKSLMLNVAYRAPAGAEEERHFLMQAVPVPDSTGKVFFGGIIQDVTEIKAQEIRQCELIRKLEAHAASAEITSTCLKTFLAEPDFDTAVNALLKNIGEHGAMDRLYIGRFSEDGATVSNAYEWTRTEAPPQHEIFQDVSVELLPHWTEMLREKQTVVVPSTDNPPEEFLHEVSVFQSLGSRSLISEGIWVNGKLWGVFGSDYIAKPAIFTDVSVEAIRTVARALEMVIARRGV